MDAIREDFVLKQYYVTADLTRSLYSPDCLFVDPTTTVQGVEKYAAALKLLFDPVNSKADMISLKATGPNTFDLKWRLEGRLRLGGLRIKPYTGTTTYTLNGEGLIVSHKEVWDISVTDAFLSTFIPSFGSPAAPPVASQPTTSAVHDGWMPMSEGAPSS